MKTNFFAWAFVWLFALTACNDPPAADRPALIVNEETTFVTGPLTADGQVDFVAAYNEFAGKGVTKETNAAAALAEVIGMPGYLIGPSDDETAVQSRVAALLDVTPGPPLPDIRLDSDLVHRGPWKASDSPKSAETAKQLAYLQPTLDAAVEALQKTHWFFPGVATTQPGMPLAIPFGSHARSLAKTLVARGFLHQAEGDAQAAWRDIQAASRLGTLLQQEPMLIPMLSGLAVTSLADASTQRLALHVTDRAVLDEMLRDVANRPVLTADRAFWGERLYTIAMLRDIWREPDKCKEVIQALGTGPGPELSRSEMKRVLSAIRDADPNAVLRAYNRLADQRDALLRTDDRQAATTTIATRDAQKAETEKGLLKRLPPLDASPEDKTQWCADATVVLETTQLQGLRDILDRSEQTRRVTMTAVALELYKLDRGEYPAALDALAPAYLAAVPTDLFTGLPMIYRPHDDTYDLYSVGPDGDDGGVVPKDAAPKAVVSATMQIRAEASEAKNEK